MDIETTLAQDIRITEDKAKYDAACKKLLSEKIILAWIMKSCLDEYRECTAQEITEKYIEGQPQVGEVPVAPDETNVSRIHGISNEDTSLTEGTITYDIRFTATVPVSGEYIRLIINVEAQNAFNPGYPLLKRAIYYCSRMISAQYGTEFTDSHYERIKKVYSIWIAMSPPKNRENTITRYRIVEEALVGSVQEPIRNYDLMTTLMLCLGGPDDENYSGVLKLLDVLLSTETGAAEKQKILQEDFDIPMTQTLERRLSDMCNLSDGVEARGIEKGIQKGIEKGRAEGRVEGILSSIHSLVENTGWPAEKAMEVLGIPKAEYMKYLALLNK